MNVSQLLKRKAKDEASKATKVYARIVIKSAGGEKLAKGELADLADAMHTLGFDAARVDADVATIRQRAALAAQYAERDAIYEQTQPTIDELAERMAKGVELLTIEFRKQLMADLRRLESAKTRRAKVDKLPREIEALERDNPHLFGGAS